MLTNDWSKKPFLFYVSMWFRMKLYILLFVTNENKIWYKSLKIKQHQPKKICFSKMFNS